MTRPKSSLLPVPAPRPATTAVSRTPWNAPTAYVSRPALPQRAVSPVVSTPTPHRSTRPARSRPGSRREYLREYLDAPESSAFWHWLLDDSDLPVFQPTASGWSPEHQPDSGIHRMPAPGGLGSAQPRSFARLGKTPSGRVAVNLFQGLHGTVVGPAFSPDPDEPELLLSSAWLVALDSGQHLVVEADKLFPERVRPGQSIPLVTISDGQKALHPLKFAARLGLQYLKLAPYLSIAGPAQDVLQRLSDNRTQWQSLKPHLLTHELMGYLPYLGFSDYSLWLMEQDHAALRSDGKKLLFESRLLLNYLRSQGSSWRERCRDVYPGDEICLRTWKDGQPQLAWANLVTIHDDDRVELYLPHEDESRFYPLYLVEPPGYPLSDWSDFAESQLEDISLGMIYAEVIFQESTEVQTNRSHETQLNPPTNLAESVAGQQATLEALQLFFTHPESTGAAREAVQLTRDAHEYIYVFAQSAQVLERLFESSTKVDKNQWYVTLNWHERYLNLSAADWMAACMAYTLWRRDQPLSRVGYYYLSRFTQAHPQLSLPTLDLSQW